MSSSNASPPSAASRSLSEDEPRKLVGKFKEFEALLLRDGDVETKALELQAAAADLVQNSARMVAAIFAQWRRK